ncbi:transketolase C-terminal domain-containing protein [Paracoccus sulfuroxidans]|uniref:2-oxoglutarate dehydrogenase E1 component n=1 Tax=Paracoccus sulfuroxidans TaxID=384678 RepID=A0A562NQI6_9RHOB|nr:transketolase C-terminal domain-containing protein [Paracoccus sulfuroxidans]TWI34330.1 2-oxoisovalerate dehydrogenase E1 component [Paracoccus sulfuroxidans]
MGQAATQILRRNAPSAAIDWRAVVRHVAVSRALDELEETRLVPEKKIHYQFSARGHDMAQVLLGLQLTGAHDALCGYYRSRPLLLSIGVPPVEALGSAMAREGGYSDGRDIGVVFNYPTQKGAMALPMSGGVGTQYTPTAGWAQALNYYADVMGSAPHGDSIGVVLGGDGSVAANGFWASLVMATTLRLPMLFYIEDNGYGISVPSTLQTPNGNIAANLSGWQGLTIFEGDGTDPAEAARLTAEAVAHVRKGRAPAMLRLTVPRLEGHSFQDTQTYKSEKVIAAENARDPWPKLQNYLVPSVMTQAEWDQVLVTAATEVEAAREAAEARPPAKGASVLRHVFYDGEMQQVGGCLRGEMVPSTDQPAPEGQRINMVTTIRRVLDQEMARNNRMVIFGEDVGQKGGVHAVTLGMQEKFGTDRVFDTSLSEEGIIGRAVGMSLAGLLPVPEIQFRKYAEPATEQINDCGSLRWRTNNRFAAPMVVRMPVGFFKSGDPCHSQTNEVAFLHAPGWRVAVPSNAEDAVGLLRTALRGNDPVMFLEHRAMLDHSWARRPWPGNDFALPFGKARFIRRGDRATVVTWGGMVERCDEATRDLPVDLLDLRTLSPWDREAVLASVSRTHRCLIVHEDLRSAGFGAEIAATVASEGFQFLDAPVERLTMPDVPSPYSPVMLEHVLPSVSQIRARLQEMMEF